MGVLITGAEEFGLVGARVFAEVGRAAAGGRASSSTSTPSTTRATLYLVTHDRRGARARPRGPAARLAGGLAARDAPAAARHPRGQPAARPRRRPRADDRAGSTGGRCDCIHTPARHAGRASSFATAETCRRGRSPRIDLCAGSDAYVSPEDTGAPRGALFVGSTGGPACSMPRPPAWWWSAPSGATKGRASWSTCSPSGPTWWCATRAAPTPATPS